MANIWFTSDLHCEENSLCLKALNVKFQRKTMKK